MYDGGAGGGSQGNGERSREQSIPGAQPSVLHAEESLSSVEAGILHPAVVALYLRLSVLSA